VNISDLFDQSRSNDELEEQEREARAYAKALAVVECHFCDDAGYRGHIVCDHVDRRKTYATGMRKVRRALKNPNIGAAT
jgi:hypothetical protein